VSPDPTNYRNAPTECIRRILETVTGTPIPRGEVLKTDKIGSPYAQRSPFHI
jgi:5-oxoprolinase (ATP-hydrolysing)